MPVAGFPQFGKFDRPSADADRMLLGQVVDSANALSALARVACTANTTINSTTLTAITGATTTFTPTLDVRALVVATFDCATVTAGQALVGKLRVNGVDQAPSVLYNPSTNGERATVSQSWAVDLTAGVVVTLALWAQIGLAGASFSIQPTHTGFTVLLVPR